MAELCTILIPAKPTDNLRIALIEHFSLSLESMIFYTMRIRTRSSDLDPDRPKKKNRVRVQPSKNDLDPDLTLKIILRFPMYKNV